MNVSIIIINYNTFELTSQCIRSIYEKTKYLNFEIILVDNASTECSGDLFKEKFPQIKLIKSPANVGFAKGNNLGLEHALYEYILLLNSDIELINNAIYIACKKLEHNQNIGALSGKLLHADGRIQPIAGKFPSLWREFKELLRINKFLTRSQRSEEFLGTEFDYQSYKEVDWIWGAFFLTKRSVIDQLPDQKLHDNFFMYVEDMQWCYAIKKLKYKIAYDPEACAYHYISSSATDFKTEKEKYRKKILPNLYQWFNMEKGWLYTKCYYLIKIIHYYSLGTMENKENAKFHINFILGKKS